MGEKNTTHPTAELLAGFLAGTLADADRLQVEQHVQDCAACCAVLRVLPDETLLRRMRLAETSQLPGDTAAGLAAPAAGDGAAEGEVFAESADLPPELARHSRYRIVRKLGSGGMGVVYEAEHRLMQRTVALKVVSRRLVQNREAIDRFHQEVRAAAMLAHRNIVTAFDAEQAGDLHFLVMEFVEGLSLAEIVARHGQLPVLHACNFAMQAAQGLQHAAEHGMVHRDIKPQNLMRTASGVIKILDFGLARLASEVDSGRLTRAGSALGTADYIAPEQIADSRHVDSRADIYSLGCTLYFLLAGHVPFPDGSAVDKVMAHLKRQARSLADVRPDVPHELVQVVERMMAKDPDKRFASPVEVVAALKPFGSPAAARGDVATAASRSAASAPAAPQSPAAEPPPAIDLFDIPFEELQGSRPPVHLQPALLPASPLARLPWQRAAIAAGIVAILVVAGLWVPPVLRGLLANRDGGQLAGGAGASGDSQPPSVGDGSAGASVAPPLPDDSGWIDLIPAEDVPIEVVGGTWERRGSGLDVAASPFARIALPGTLPEEYEFEATFTRHTGRDSIALIFVAGSGQATFEVDAWREHLAGVQNIRGQTMQQQAQVAHRRLVNGTRYTALVRVRRGEVTAHLDGEQLAVVPGDGADLSVLEGWQLPRASLGIGSYESSATFHRVRIRPLVRR